MNAAILVELSSRMLKGFLFWLAIAVLISSIPYGQKDAGAHRLFDEGNILYQQQDFSAALEKYHQIEELGLISPALYFNIGNAYYRLDRIGRAILYYERALRLDPKDEDILANLAIANQAAVDRITAPPQFALASWIRWALYLFPVSALLRSLAIIYLLLGSLAISLVLTRSNRLRSLLKRFCLLTCLFLVVTSLFFLAQWQDSRDHVEAIVLVQELPARDAPASSAVEVFSIHEGTKVRIVQSSKEWVEIVLADGKIGWVSSDGIESI